MRHRHKLSLSQENKDKMGREIQRVKSHVPQVLRHQNESLESIGQPVFRRSEDGVHLEKHRPLQLS